MQYYIPQFIESESQVIGPLTLKQFFLITIPIGVIFVLYFIFKIKIIVFLFGSIFIFGGVALAFLKFQGQDLTAIVTYGLSFFSTPRNYVWFKEGNEKYTIKEVKKISQKKENIIPQVNKEGSRLRILSWKTQTKEK